MKRRWFGVFLALFSSMSSVLLTIPLAYASAEGGIAGVITLSETANPSSCPAGSFVDIKGPTTQQFPIGSGPNFNTGLKLSPGSYTVSVSCLIPGNPINFSFASVDVQPGHTTNLGGATCSAGAPIGGGCVLAAAAAPAVDCDAGPAFSWLICGAIKTMVKTVDTIRDSVIVPFLKEPPFDKNQPEFASAFKIWSAFRNVASVFFILVFFMVIIGTALGFDNYTIKKVLPHLVAGAILVPFSWYLCAFVIDIGNVLGQGLVALMTSIIPVPKIDLTSSFEGILVTGIGGVTGFVLAGAAVAGIGLPLVISLLIAFFGVFATLIFRKILILLMVVLSPFALLAWVLPNTEKWFREWWQNFFKLVMMYPIIMMLFEAGRLFSATAGAANSTTGAAWVTQLFAISGLILPLFLVPFAFKFAGKGLAMGSGAIGKLGGSVDKRYGKDSAFAKDMAEGRARKNFNTAQNAKTAAGNASGLRKLALQKKSAYNMKRAGLSGASGSAALRRQAATPKLSGELDALDGEKRAARELDPEAWSQRRAAGTQKFVDERAAARGARQGIVEGFEGGGRPLGSTAQSAARIKARDAYLAGIGSAEGTVEDDRLNERERTSNPANYVSPSTRVGAGRETAALQSSEARGAALGTVRGGAEAEGIIRDQTGVGAADARDIRLRTVGQAKTNLQVAGTVAAQQAANTNVSANIELDQKQIADAGGAITPQQARSMRLQNLSASTHTQEREKIGLAEGAVNAQNSVTAAAGHESISGLVGGGQLASREQIATARTLRETRSNLQATGAGAMSTSQVLDSSRSEASKRLGASIGAQKQELAQEHEDVAKAQRDGAPAPRLEDRVIAGMEAAKPRTAQESAQRIAAVRAVRDGTAASTAEHTDAAVHQAERATTLANATTKGVAGTVNAEVEAKTRDLQRRAAGSGITVSDSDARAQAAGVVRARNLGATAKVSRAVAESKTATEISTDIGGAKTLNTEISTEKGAVQAKAIAAGAKLPDSVARERAETNVRARQISAASDVAASQGAVKLAAERNQVRGVQDSLQSQEVEEAARLQAVPGSTITAEQAAAQAKTNVAQKNIQNSGDVFRQKASRDDKDATAATTGTANELKATIATESKLSGVSAQQAALNVRARDLKNVGVNATDASLRKASADRGTSIGTSRAIEAEIQGEAEAIQAASSTPLSPGVAAAQATAAVTARNINSASRAAQITAQGVRTKAPRTELGTIETYDAAIEAAQNKPTTDAKNAAYQAEFDRAQKAEGLKAKAQVEKAGPQLAADARTKAIAALGASATAAAKTAAGDAAHQEVIAKIATQATQAQKQAEESIGRIEGDKAGRIAAAAPALVQAALPREQAEQNLIRSIGVAAEESSMRAESAVQGQVEALNQAVDSPSRLDASTRLSVQTEGAVAQLAAESAASQARFDLTSAGQPLNRSYQMAESMAKSVQREQILRARVAEESKGAFSWKDKDGNVIVSDTVQGAPLSEEAIEAMGKEVDQLMSTEGGKQPQTARAIAIMTRLKQSSPGMEELRRINVDVFGGSDTDTVDPTLFGGESKTIWDMSVEGAKAADLHIPRIAIYDGVPPKDFAPMDWRSKRDYLKYINRNGEKNPKVEREAAENIFGFLTDPRQANNLDGDQYKAMGMYLYPPAGASEKRTLRAEALREKIKALHTDDDVEAGQKVLDQIKGKYDTLKSESSWAPDRDDYATPPPQTP